MNDLVKNWKDIPIRNDNRFMRHSPKENKKKANIQIIYLLSRIFKLQPQLDTIRNV